MTPRTPHQSRRPPSGPTPSLCQPAPASALRQLRQGAYEAIQAILGRECIHEPPETIAQYRPHVSVAYINAPGAAQPIVSALQGAMPGPVTTALDSASVLTFHRDNGMYEWTTATRLPIG